MPPMWVVNSYFIIHSMRVITAGSNNVNNGTISSVWNGGGNPAGPTMVSLAAFQSGQMCATQSCIYQVPAGHTLYVTNYKIGGVGGSTNSGAFYLMAKQFGSLLYNCVEVAFTNFGNGYAYRDIKPPMRFTEKTTIKLSSGVNLGGGTTMDLCGSIDGVLVAN